MNWDRLEDLIRKIIPEATEGIGETLRQMYQGEAMEVVDNPLAEAQRKIVRDEFVTMSKRPEAKDNARHFVSWAISEGWEFKVNERYKSAGNIRHIVNAYWAMFGEDQEINQPHDDRILYIFKRLWWSKTQKLHFLRNHQASKLTYYAWLAYNARPEEIERQEYYLTPKGMFEGDQRLERIFRDHSKFFFVEDPKYWEAMVHKGYIGHPKKRSEWIEGTPEWTKRRKS